VIRWQNKNVLHCQCIDYLLLNFWLNLSKIDWHCKFFTLPSNHRSPCMLNLLTFIILIKMSSQRWFLIGFKKSSNHSVKVLTNNTWQLNSSNNLLPSHVYFNFCLLANILFLVFWTQAEKSKLNFKDRYPEWYRNSHPSAPVIVPWASGVVSAWDKQPMPQITWSTRVQTYLVDCRHAKLALAKPLSCFVGYTVVLQHVFAFAMNGWNGEQRIPPNGHLLI